MDTLDLIALAKQCPDVTLSVKASDLDEYSRSLIAGVLNELRGDHPVFQVPEEEKLVTRDYALERLSVSAPTLWRWKKSGYLVPVRVGSMDRYRLSDINALIAKRGGES